MEGKKMTAATMLMKEIETLPEESMAEALDFIVFLKIRSAAKQTKKISIKDAYGIFNGLDTHFERDEEDCKSKRISTKNARGIFKDMKGIDTTIEREETDRV
jgi:hypothetical protein